MLAPAVYGIELQTLVQRALLTKILLASCQAGIFINEYAMIFLPSSFFPFFFAHKDN